VNGMIVRDVAIFGIRVSNTFSDVAGQSLRRTVPMDLSSQNQPPCLGGFFADHVCYPDAPVLRQRSPRLFHALSARVHLSSPARSARKADLSLITKNIRANSSVEARKIRFNGLFREML